MLDLLLAEELGGAIDAGLISQGAERVIIDLRDNPGGLYDVVVRCLDFFTEKNSLLIYTERDI